MFLKHPQIAPARISGLLKSAEAAARSIPPAFPLDATVAVNPFLGQSGQDLAAAGTHGTGGGDQPHPLAGSLRERHSLRPHHGRGPCRST